jgi:elongation factor 2
MSVLPTNKKDLPKLVEALKRLVKSCPLVEVALEDTGSVVVAGCGEDHMRLLKQDLEQEFLPGVPCKWDDPCITYKETVQFESTMTVLSKSPNKHNRLYVKADALVEELNLAVEKNKVYPTQELKARSKILEKEFGWDKTDTQKIWGFGPAPEEAGGAYGPNILVDQTKGIQYLNEIKETVNSGLLWAAKEGPIAEENMRGIRFNLLDVKLHADSIHRGMGQIQPTARRVFYAAVMKSGCCLTEPIFNASIDATAEAQPGIMQALGACRGEFVQADDVGDRLAVQAFVPAAETIGQKPFATVLSQKTNGQASVNYEFDHWQNISSDPLDCDKFHKPNTKAAEIMLAIRKRKGLKESPPDFFDYYDKL